MAKKIPLLIASLIAFFHASNLAYATDVGSVSEGLLEPTAIVTQILVYVCYIVGVVFFFMAMAQYKVHRESPKLVPLSTPVMFVLFGAILVLLPYFTGLFNSGSALEYIKKEGYQEERHKGLELPPLEVPRRKGPGDFSRGSRDESVPTQPSTPAAPPTPAPLPGGGHWSDEPQYQ